MLLRYLLLLGAPLAAAAGVEFRVSPYTDPSQLDCPWPKHSHYKQPWRGYIETKSGWEFLKGVGINLQIPEQNEELAVKLLAESGFKNFRMEVGFGESHWDEWKLNHEEKHRRRLALCKTHSVRPTLLINAHHGVPCPTKTTKRQLTSAAPAGARRVQLDDVGDLVIGRSGFSQLSDNWAAEALITDINFETREVTLSKALPKPLPAGEIAITTLKVPPLHPVGTPEFDETVAGWIAHTLRVCRLAREAGIDDFDLEIWNELTFGTHFLDINAYYDRLTPKFPERQPDPLLPGGRCWELARRTVEAVHAEYPRARCIWGFSNTTFHHTPIDKLPPGMDGQSYHPYGTGTRKFTGESARRDEASLEGFVPRYELRMPEGFMHTFVQSESLMRLLNPLDRLTRKPPGVRRFHHFMTEHGVLAQECGVTDEAGAWKLKALCAIRSFALWLNKGIDVLHYFNAYEKDPRSFGLLPANLPTLAPDTSFDQAATPPLRAVRNLTRAFAGSTYLERTKSLQIEITALGEERKVFEGEGTHPPLWEREVLAALPFQINADKHLVVVYVMTRDATQPLAPQLYRLRIAGANGSRVSAYDPHENKAVTIEARTGADGTIDVVLPVTSHPRLLTISR